MLKIKGTSHTDFGDGWLDKNIGERFMENQSAYTPAFFNKYLKGKKLISVIYKNQLLSRG